MLTTDLHRVVDEILAADKTLEKLIPVKPEEPLPQDCCGCSCQPCVFDTYRTDLDVWAKQCLRILKPELVSESDLLADEFHPKVEKSVNLEPNEYSQFKLLSITEIAKNTNIYKFELPIGCGLNLPIGTHLIIKGLTKNGKSITRPFTPVNLLDQLGSFDLMIKTYDYGQMSSYIRALTVGSLVDMRGPFGQFTYKANEYSNILMLAAGTGLAPMVQVIQKVLTDPTDETRIRLLYSCRTYDEILLKQRIDEWKRFWNFTVCYYLTKQKEGDIEIKFGDDVKFDKIRQDDIRQEVKKIVVPESSLVLICGTKAFDKDMMNYVYKCGALVKRLFKF